MEVEELGGFRLCDMVQLANGRLMGIVQFKKRRGTPSDDHQALVYCDKSGDMFWVGVSYLWPAPTPAKAA